jgi:hypothetical protein
MFMPLYTPNDIIHKCKKYNTIFKFTVTDAIYTKNALQLLHYFLHKVIHVGNQTYV